MTIGDRLRFSVVIPAYNESEYLARTLRSLRQQDFRGQWEVIVVDNASTDDTATVAEHYGARVLHEHRRGVCAARQRGTNQARGEIVVSTDADTVHPTTWLSTIDRTFRKTHGGSMPLVAVAGPCRYESAPSWAAIIPPLYFRAIAAASTLTGRLGYLTATNVAFLRDGFPGYDLTMTQGGDEVDLLHRLQEVGYIAWNRSNSVLTSSRRMNQGLLHTLAVSYGYHYAGAYLINRASGRTVIGPAPAIRTADIAQVANRRRMGTWLTASSLLLIALARIRRYRSMRNVRSTRYQRREDRG